MSTGIKTWNMNMLDIGPMYPFPGTEVLLVLIGLGTWIVWHIIQIRSENKVYDEDVRIFSDKKKLEDAMNVSNAETLNESLKTHGGNFGG